MNQNIKIKNFKCFLDNEIPIKNLTVFAGANGSGKSTVIQALLLLRQTIDRLKFHSARENFPMRIMPDGSYKSNPGNSKDITCVKTDSDQIELIFSSADTIIKAQYIASKDQPELFVQTTPNKQLIETLRLNNSELSILSNCFHYLTAERIGPRIVQPISDQEYLSTGFSGEYTAYAMYKAGDDAIEQERCIYNKIIGKSNLLKKQAEAWMDLILPGIEMLSELYESTNSARVGLRRKASETDCLKSPNIGFGVTYALPIIVSGLIAEKGSMLIVENPEAHLHPSGQSKIGQFLGQIAGAGIQVVVETHSEHIINGIRLAVLKKTVKNTDVIINFFEQERKTLSPHIESITINENADLSNWPKGFLDQEEIDLGEIFKLKRQKNAS